MERWKIKVDNEDNIKEEHLKLIFSQSEKKFEETHETGKSISDRSYTLLGFIITIIIGITGYLFSEIFVKNNPKYDLIPFILIDLYLYFIIWYMRKNIFPNIYYSKGSSPKKLMVNDYFKDELKERTTRYLYMNEIENYQFRIDKNEELNTKRWKVYKDSLKFLLITPLVFLIIYLIHLYFK